MDAIILTSEQVADFYTANFTKKRAERAQRNNSNVPTEGTFVELSKAVYKSEDGSENVYPVIKVADKNGAIIGEIAIGTLMQQKSAGKARKITRESSEYVGKYFHVGTPISRYNGLNEIDIVSGLLGKSFKAKSLPDTIVPAIKIVNGKPVMYETEETAIAAVDTKDCYQFTIL